MAGRHYELVVERGAFEVEFLAVLADGDGRAVASRPLLSVEAGRCDDAFVDAAEALLAALADAGTEASALTGDVSRIVLPLADFATFMQEHPIRHAGPRTREAPALPPAPGLQGPGQDLPAP